MAGEVNDLAYVEVLKFNKGNEERERNNDISTERKEWQRTEHRSHRSYVPERLLLLRRMSMDNMKNAILEGKGAAVVNDGCASSLPSGTATCTIGKITYIANLHFKSQGQTFSQKLKRVLRADCG